MLILFFLPLVQLKGNIHISSKCRIRIGEVSQSNIHVTLKKEERWKSESPNLADWTKKTQRNV